jgi:predicted ATPase
LSEARQIGAARYEPFHLGIAADAYARAGRREEARTSIAKAFAALALGHHEAFSADLYRTRAIVSVRMALCESAEAAADLRHALEIARRQKAPSLQLRAARDLARLLVQQGDGQHAIELLGPIYGRFAEGFDTLDLKETNTLLDELRA